MTARLVLKSLLAALLMPGVVVGLVPYLILRGSEALSQTSPVSFWTGLSFILGLGGFVMLTQAIARFATQGKGTLAPVDPPKHLVLGGLYNHTRNPMYVGVLLILAGEAAFFESTALLFYAMVVFVLFHLFVRWYEEPHLRKQFGIEYEEYCRRVPRWPLSSCTGRQEEGHDS